MPIHQKMKRKFYHLLCIFILMSIGFVGIESFATAAALKLGDNPALIVNDFNGNSFDMSKERGKWVLIHFFASWCPACKTEMPELVKLCEKSHLEMIALSPEPSRKKNELKNFMKPYPLRTALLADAKTNDFGYGMSLPTTFLIDKAGKIKLIFTPEENKFDVKKIESLISE